MNDQDVRISAAGAGNNLPDIFMVSRGVLMNLVNVGLVAPVDTLYDQMPVRSERHYDELSRRFTTIDGRAWGLADPGATPRNEGLLIRKDWLDALGLDVPVTSDDFMNVMRAFTSGPADWNGNMNTFGFGAFLENHNVHEGALGRRFDPLMGAFGVAGTWNLKEEQLGLNIRNPEYFDALSFVRQMVEERVIDPNWVSHSRDTFRAAWKQGTFGIMREQNAAFAAQNNYRDFDINFPNGEWIVIDPPVGPNGHQSVGVDTPSFRIYAISTRAMYQGKAAHIVRLLEWMTSESYFLFGWGVEGDNFLFDENGVPTVAGIPDPARGFNRSEMQKYTQLRNMVFFNGDVELAARFPVWTTAAGRQKSAEWVLRDMQSRPWTLNTGSDALPQPNADVRRFWEQGIVEFVIGSRTLNRENWDSWLAEFDQIGGAEWEDTAIAAAKELGFVQTSSPLTAAIIAQEN
jgi:putative aldouronate transport system substrate-binding protein